MSKKKTTSKKKGGQAKATTEDATFESVLDQPVGAKSVGEESSGVESARRDPSIQITTPEDASQKKGGGALLPGWLFSLQFSLWRHSVSIFSAIEAPLVIAVKMPLRLPRLLPRSAPWGIQWAL